MRSRHILLAAGLAVLIVAAGLLAWEFLLEEWMRTAFFPGVPPDTAGQNWQVIEIGLSVAVIAAAVPAGIALRLARQHVRATRELAVAQERVKVIAANPDWLWEVDENAVYTYASPKVTELLGYAPEEIVGKTPFDLMPPAEAERVAEEFAAIVAERRAFSLLENVNRHKDGHLVVTETSGVPILDAKGVFRGYRGIDRDVTEHKTMDRQLAEQKALLEAIFEAIPDAIGTADMDRRMITVNRGFTETFGYTPEEVAGRTTEFLYENEAEFLRLGRLRYNPSAHGPSPVFTHNQRRKDGRLFPAEVRGGPIHDAAGAKIGYLAVIRDITERLDLERRAQEARTMEAIGHLTAGIAHDFNNMLQAVQGNVELALHLTDGNERVRRLLDDALTASRRSAKLTQQLLSFARRDILHPKAVDSVGLIAGKIGLLKSVVGEAVTVATDLAAGLPPIAVDPQTLETALVNIAANARAAMPDGGTLTIRTAARRLDEELAIEDGSLTAGDYVEIAVSDTGCGMSERVREKAFEPFFTTRAVGQASGLGLSVVQGFARQSGGHAAIASTPGLGTTITLLLPAADQSAGNPSA